MRRLIVGITGASGVIYGKSFVESAIEKRYEVYLMITDLAKKIAEKELSFNIEEHFSKKDVVLADYKELDSPLASGSFLADAMVIIPCSMATLSDVATGASRNLITRCADVSLKERRKLILVLRETPLSEIHLENMLKLRRMGADILPAMPGFYKKPRSIEDLVHFLVEKVFGCFEKRGIADPALA
jgi:4-hydroxy-3-polyprenylbenzoate decarboxylase